MIKRRLEESIRNSINKGKAILLVGPRQVGKTTLIKSMLAHDDYLFLDGDDPSVRESLTDVNTARLRQIIGRHSQVFIDEAQRIPQIGITLKLITDQIEGVQLWVSGSSAFELSDHTMEPLTGRKREYLLYPFSWSELEDHFGYMAMQQQLELRLRYGMYPEVVNSPGEEVMVLQELANSYLYKDVLAFGGIRKPQVLDKLLKALALQVGHEVSYNELAQLVGVDKNTVSTYIDLLEKSYVIFRLGSFSRNLRNEIKRGQKIYFYDNGIRNMLIGNFNDLDLRTDVGALWENFLVCERQKKQMYEGAITQSYFWRTVAQQEIDYIEEGHGEIKGYEFKWNTKAKIKKHLAFKQAYNAELSVVHRENFREFIS
ncbi:ATP-binding protein [Sediminicola luteus]|uniref:ATPase n=1 Tax=Sediminicola luteus TaxID=319238 RepID=A0A2A4GFF9_9FLAO|nr:ATP-binding protein [Sediminicola luteus]PCE66718.1 ATPase [Sediminicola luteus]